MRKMKNVILAGILSICMVVGTLPVELLAQETENMMNETDKDDVDKEQKEADKDNIDKEQNEAENGQVEVKNSQYEIISFEELPKEIIEQSVYIGTSKEELTLPDTLTVVCRFVDEEGEKETAKARFVKYVDNMSVDEKDNKADEMAAGGKVDKNSIDVRKDEEKVSESGADTGESGERSSESDAEAEEGKEKTSEDDADTVENEEKSSENDTGKGADEEKIPKGGADIGENEENPAEADVDTEEGVENPSEADVDTEEDEEKPSEADADTEENEEKTPETDVNTKEDEEAEGKDETGNVVIEGIIWTSMPEYDAEAEGCYVFVPVIPERYGLADEVKLPEISVTVAEAEVLLEDVELSDVSGSTEPVCGVISSDTTWGAGTLSDGALTVEEGVTLTITGVITVSGDVTINGGGMIKRGDAVACFNMDVGSNLVLGNIVIDGNSVDSENSMISVRSNAALTLDDRCTIENCIIIGEGINNGGAVGIDSRGTLFMKSSVIKNCHANNGYGGAIDAADNAIIVIDNGIIKECTAMYGGAIASMGKITIKYATIEYCCAKYGGGAIETELGEITIEDGVYANNRTIGTESAYIFKGGGFIYNMSTKLHIYGGIFIGNVSVASGNCIFHSSSYNTITEISGGYFEGNGKDAITVSSTTPSGNEFILSGNIHFSNGENSDADIDGVFMGTNGKIHINDAIISPVPLYIPASEGLVIAEGKDDYKIRKSDAKKISVINTSAPEEIWYAVLNEATYEIYLTQDNPAYGYFVNYYSNGAEGTVTDDKEYTDSDNIVIIKDAETLSCDGYVFDGWNTKPDGTGTSYAADDTLTITGDIDLYAQWKAEPETVTARFYSGMTNEPDEIKVTYEVGDDGASMQTLKLRDMTGWTALGWNTAEDKYSPEIEAETEVPISEDTEYYGIYKKDITLSYDINYTPDGVIDAPDSQAKTAYANVHKTTSHSYPKFTIAEGLTRPGYTFDGWYSDADGSGVSYETGSEVPLEEDTILYAHWTRNSSQIYKVEHYCQNTDDDGYTRMDSDTQEIEGIIGETVTAQPKNYEGFTENREHSGRVSSGVIEKDAQLTLKLYYDRNVYQVNFDLNYTYTGNDSATIPPMQTLRYGQKLGSVTTPERKGWSFKGWYKSREAADSIGDNISGNVGDSADSNINKDTSDNSNNRPWNFDSAIEDNIDISELSSVTLYAGWADDIAPVLNNASYNTGYKDLVGWIIRKKNLIITVPVTEEGSGVDTAEYTLTSDNGNSVSGVTHIESAYVPRQVRHDESVQLYTGENATENTTASIQFNTENGQVSVIITVSEDYKGSIYLKCSDKVRNNSGQKNLTVENGGIIVEDNAPKISFLTGNVENSKVSVKVTVSDEDDKAGNVYITGGIAEITYQIDDKEPKNVTYKELENNIDFQSNIVTACDFKVEISGAGTHTLKVTAVDNAGNENSQSTKVSISGGKVKKKTSVIKNGNIDVSANYGSKDTSSEFTYFVQTSKPPMTKNREPNTGDESMRVEVYATVAMIAGLLYIFLYFSTGNNGMTEQEKNEFVSRLAAWAKKGRKYRRFVAIVIIFGVLFYYHSIGKCISVEWKEIYEK